MSWDSYIDNLIAQSKDASGGIHCDKVAIIGKDGSKWTSDGHGNSLRIGAGEITTLAQCFKTGNFTSLQASGIRVENVKYQFLREEDNKVVYGKAKGNGGVTLQSSKTAIIIGHTAEGKQQGNTNKAVSVIANYLEEQGM